MMLMKSGSARDELPPNACRSAAASALQRAPQKANDLAREAVGCNGLFGAVFARQVR